MSKVEPMHKMVAISLNIEYYVLPMTVCAVLLYDGQRFFPHSVTANT